MSTVYVIVNESLPIGGPYPVTDVLHPARGSRQAALDDLAAIAAQFNLDFDEEGSNVFVPVEGTHLESDEYYIMELEVT